MRKKKVNENGKDEKRREVNRGQERGRVEESDENREEVRREEKSTAVYLSTDISPITLESWRRGQPAATATPIDASTTIDRRGGRRELPYAARLLLPLNLPLHFIQPTHVLSLQLLLVQTHTNTKREMQHGGCYRCGAEQIVKQHGHAYEQVLLMYRKIAQKYRINN